MRAALLVVSFAVVLLTGCAVSSNRDAERGLSADDNLLIGRIVEHDRWRHFLEAEQNAAPDGAEWARAPSWYKFRFSAELNALFAPDFRELPSGDEAWLAMFRDRVEEAEELRVELLRELLPRLGDRIGAEHLKPYAAAPRDEKGSGAVDNGPVE